MWFYPQGSEWLCSWYKVTQLGCATREVTPRPALPTVHKQAARASLWTHSCSSSERRAATRALAPAVCELEERPLAGVRHLPWHSPGPATLPEEGGCPQETSAGRARAIRELLNPWRAPGERGRPSQIEGSPGTPSITDRRVCRARRLGLNFCSRPGTRFLINQANLPISGCLCPSEFHIPPEITENRNSVPTRCNVSDRTTKKIKLPATWGVLDIARECHRQGDD